MSPNFWAALFGFGCLAGGIVLILWALAQAAAELDRRAARDADRAIDTDQFTPSMDRFGYVQDARNRGEL